MRECVFHFKMIQNGQSKEYRALILLPENKQPTIADFIDSFRETGLNVELENERELIFRSLKGEFKLDITKIVIKGETEDQTATAHDGELQVILKHLIGPSQ